MKTMVLLACMSFFYANAVEYPLRCGSKDDVVAGHQGLHSRFNLTRYATQDSAVFGQMNEATARAEMARLLTLYPALFEHEREVVGPTILWVFDTLVGTS